MIGKEIRSYPKLIKSFFWSVAIVVIPTAIDLITQMMTDPEMVFPWRTFGFGVAIAILRALLDIKTHPAEPVGISLRKPQDASGGVDVPE